MFTANVSSKSLFLQVFDKIDKKYTAIELDTRDDGEDIQNILSEITGARTVGKLQFLFVDLCTTFYVL